MPSLVDVTYLKGDQGLKKIGILGENVGAECK